MSNLHMLSGSPRRDELTVKRLSRGNGNLHVLKNEKLPQELVETQSFQVKGTTGSIQLM